MRVAINGNELEIGSGESEGRPPFTHAQRVADVDAIHQRTGAERFVLAGVERRYLALDPRLNATVPC